MKNHAQPTKKSIEGTKKILNTAKSHEAWMSQLAHCRTRPRNSFSNLNICSSSHSFELQTTKTRNQIVYDLNNKILKMNFDYINMKLCRTCKHPRSHTHSGWRICLKKGKLREWREFQNHAKASRLRSHRNRREAGGRSGKFQAQHHRHNFARERHKTALNVVI